MDDLDTLIDNLNSTQNISNTSINEDYDITTNNYPNNFFEKLKSNSIIKCKNCRSNSLIYNHEIAILVCQNCGVYDQSNNYSDNSYSDKSLDQDQSTYILSTNISNKLIFRIKRLTSEYSRKIITWNSVNYTINS